MITCPSEITAISIADGCARVTGRPQAVIVHVDVGTQALGQGVHNASVGRAPIFIFAGLCPYTESGELTGSRTEYMHWLQEAPDQKAIVRQYCRYTGEIRTGMNVKQLVGRALQFAMSAPKGPVYLTAAREVLAEEIEPYSLRQEEWVPIGPVALPVSAVHDIATALVQAEKPLVITGYSGRDRRTPELLATLADLIPGIRIHDTGGSDMCFPSTHPASEGFCLSFNQCTQDADVIFMLDCDIPWIPSRNPPLDHARIYHVDIDPLNQQIPVSFFPAHGRWRADSFTALSQLVNYIANDSLLTKNLQHSKYAVRKDERAQAYEARVKTIRSQPCLDHNAALTAHNIGNLLKRNLPENTTFVVEAVTASQSLHDQLQPSRPGSWINCGGTGIGWSNGAALGVKLALKELEKEGMGNRELSFVCQIVGDGSFMCAAPSSALWVASKYEIPILTIVLNNGGKQSQSRHDMCVFYPKLPWVANCRNVVGWKAPRNSTQLVYPNGLNKTATDEETNTSFHPTPNYAALAEAAAGSEAGWSNREENGTAWMNGVRVRTVAQLEEALKHAIARVRNERKGMLIEAIM